MQIMLRLYYVCVVVIAVFLPFYTNAGESAKAQSFLLQNGMEVVLINNNKMPVISHMVWYKIGAADEMPGKSGIAHFLEHLMFKATTNYKSGEFSRKIAQIGGNDNAFTNTDYTAYYQNIPKEKLEMVMQLEADRMHNLTFNANEVHKERDVILEERRSRIDNDPHAQLQEQMKALLFLNHPYHRPLIGWYHEMAALNVEDAQNWYKNYYNPANAILVVSGDITLATLKPLAEKYYGKLKPGAKAVRNNFIQEPEHIAPRNVSLTTPQVKQEELMRYYLAPSRIYGKCEYSYALVLLSYIMGQSDASLLYQDMVVKNKKSVEVSSYYEDLSKGPAIFAFRIIPANNVKLAEAESLLNENIARVIKNGVDEQDLVRAKKAIIAESIYAREDLKSLANIYGAAVALGLGTDYVENWDKEINAVTPAQIKLAAKYVFDIKQSVTGYLTTIASAK